MQEPPLSVKSLVGSTGSKFDIKISRAIQEFSAHNKPYMKMYALFGIEGLQKVIYYGVPAFTK